MTRKNAFKAVVVVVLIVLSSTALTTLVAAQTGEFFDGFEDDSTGTIPDGWETNYEGDESFVVNNRSLNGDNSMMIGPGTSVYPTDQWTTADSTDVSVAIHPREESGGNVRFADNTDLNNDFGVVRVGGFISDGENAELGYLNSNIEWVVLDENVNYNEWTSVRIYNLSEQDDTFSAQWESPSTSGTAHGLETFDSVPGSNEINTEIQTYSASENESYFDDYGAQVGIPTLNAVGQVVNSTGEPIEGVAVDATGPENVSDTTSSDGSFGISISEEGTYTIEFDHPEYQTRIVTRDVEPGEDLGTFELEELQMELRVSNYMEHGSTQHYEVWDTSAGENVTEDATVTSLNESGITVDQSTHELIATDNETFNDRVDIQAEHDDLVDQQYVTVANESVENLEVLPPARRFSALVGDSTVQAILIAIMGGIVATRWSTAFGGIGGIQVVITGAWFGGYVGTGIMLVGLFASMFIGLNLAANIDYTVRR